MLAQLLLLLLAVLQQAAPLPASASQATASPASASFRISGRVIDAVTGQPLSRAQVSLTLSNSQSTPNAASPANSPDSVRIEVTDPEGSFAFAGLPQGKYILSARRRGYIAQMYQQHEGFTTAIVAAPGLDSENLIFGLRPTASISGTVTDESGDGVRHAQVMLFRQILTGGRLRTIQIRQASTDDEGHYHLGHLSEGVYFVCVSARPWYAQHNPKHQFVPNGEGIAANADGNGTPTEGSLESVPDAHNQLLDVVYPVTFFPNANDLASAAPISIHSGDMETADFRLRPIPALHVLVRTPVGDPNHGLRVQVMQPVADNSAVPVSVGYTRLSPGLMEVTGVPPGRFNLAVGSSNGTEWTHRSQSLQVSVDTEVDTTQTSSLIVSGLLKMDDGSAVPQPARLYLRSSARGEGFNTQVSSTGEFTFKNNPVEAGEFEIMITEPQGLFIRNLAAIGAKTSGRSFKIETPQDVTLTVTASQGTGRITGFALKNDKPASGVMVVLAPEDLRGNPALFRRDQSDSDGSFTLRSIVPGGYTLMAIEDGWILEWENPDVLKRFLADGESLQIPPNGKLELKVKVQ